MIPQFGSVTEFSAAPNTPANGPGSRACRASDILYARTLRDTQIVTLTNSTPFPSVSIAEMSIFEGSTGAPESFRCAQSDQGASAATRVRVVAVTAKG
eukprot:scaffold100487_cov36-Phaeocystis_antarctica.AAC.2